MLGLVGDPGRADGDLDAGVGEVGEVEGDQVEREVADDVVVADPEDLAEPEPAEGEAAGILGRRRSISAQRSSISCAGSRRSAPARSQSSRPGRGSSVR